ncbi:MAG: hypothetical protein V3S55_09420 [Nitrospiraceae bacterium]
MANGETQLDKIERKLDTLCKILTGNSNPSLGLVVRFDRVEQTQKRVRWILRSITGAIVAAAVAGIIVALRSS